MDIQVSSNFERLLHELVGRDGGRLASLMRDFRATGNLAADPEVWATARSLFSAYRLDDDGISTTIRQIFRETGELLDPHSAVAVAAMRAAPREPGIPCVALACAHPAKFPDTVEAATGQHPALPPHLADLMTCPERIAIVPNDLTSVRHFIAEKARAV